ncbi:MAG: radical SAM protein, partial [Candidatus Eisenbacteria sp.]|nr:radical SAM protein [Candidatus Eisenbacteria bacterium]
EKWVLMISCGFGCPVKCAICDAGHHFHGWLTAEEILSQIDYLVDQRFQNREVPVRKFKIQFARMGEPAMNPAVLDALMQLPKRYRAPGVTPVISTVAPAGREEFLEELIRIKTRFFRPGHFRLQFSVHSTDSRERSALIGCRTWNLEDIAEYASRFVWQGDAKICLNFAPFRDTTIDPQVLADTFDPKLFVIKLTPINPTDRAVGSRVVSLIDAHRTNPAADDLVRSMEEKGFEVIVSIGEQEENAIGTNCGQMATRYLDGEARLTTSYPGRDYLLS